MSNQQDEQRDVAAVGPAREQTSFSGKVLRVAVRRHLSDVRSRCFTSETSSLSPFIMKSGLKADRDKITGDDLDAVGAGMQNIPCKDWFELCLDKYPDLPSLVLIRSLELKLFPRQLLVPPVLDLCCGDGFFTYGLGLKGIYGCDIDEKAIKQAGRLEKTYRKVWKSDARDLKIIRDAQFNSVLANCALEHIDGIGRALDSISRVLAAGGRLVMTVPGENLNNWFFPGEIASKLGLAGYGRRLCREYNKKQQHINICSLDFWTRKLEDSALTVENHFYFFRKNEYRLVTFLESFVLESFPCNFLKAVDRLFRKGIPIEVRKSFWRKVLKRIYLDAEPLDTGGELFIVARKKQKTSISCRL